MYVWCSNFGCFVVILLDVLGGLALVWVVWCWCVNFGCLLLVVGLLFVVLGFYCLVVLGCVFLVLFWLLYLGLDIGVGVVWWLYGICVCLVVITRCGFGFVIV